MKYQIYSAIFIFTFASAVMAEKQQTTFITEAAYLQSQSEWQFTLDTRFQQLHQPNVSKTAYSFAVEYGITENLQIELGTERATTFDNIDEQETEHEWDLEFAYNLVEQSGYRPHLSVSAGFSRDENTHYSAALLMSYELHHRHFIHANIGFEHCKNTVDSHENSTILALTYAFKLQEDITLLTEYTQEHPANDKANVSFYSQTSIGLIYELENDLVLGFAYGVFDPKDDLNSELTVKVSYEF